MFNNLDTSTFITQDWSQKSRPYYNIHDYKTWGSPKPLLSVHLDHGQKPLETRRLLRGHSEEKIPCL